MWQILARKNGDDIKLQRKEKITNTDLFFSVPAVRAFEERLNSARWVLTPSEWERKQRRERAFGIQVKIEFLEREGRIIAADDMKEIKELSK